MACSKKYFCNDEEETFVVAREFATTLKANDIVAFKGSMGMGKTTFTRALIEALGGGDIVSSPTFAIMNEYETSKFKVYHFDMYRVMGIDDLYSTGFFDFFETGAVMIIEWSENITEALPENIITIEISFGEMQDQRIINITRG